MKLNDAIKGMRVKNWEIRESSSGTKVVYVRFIEDKPAITVKVNG